MIQIYTTSHSEGTILVSDEFNFFCYKNRKKIISGRYKPDNSGKYVHDDSGRYVHDNRGVYVHIPGPDGPPAPPYDHIGGPFGGEGKEIMFYLTINY